MITLEQGTFEAGIPVHPKPARAMIAYDSGEVTCHAVRGGGDDGYYLGAATLADNRAVQRFALRLLEGARNRSKLDTGDRLLGFLAERVVYRGQSGVVAWITARRQAHLWLRQGKRVLNLADVPLPPLLFIANLESGEEDDWRCFALNSDAARDTTTLYHAPFWNLHEDGSFCFGNAHLPNPAQASVLGDWEAPLFESSFTHTNHPHTVRSRKAEVGTLDLWQFWRRTAAAGRFSKRSLAPAGLTLAEAVQEVERRRR